MVSQQYLCVENKLKNCVSKDKKTVDIEKLFEQLHNKKVLIAKSKDNPDNSLVGIKINNYGSNGNFIAIYTDVEQIPIEETEKFEWAYVLFDNIFFNTASPFGVLYYKFDGLVINPFNNRIIIRKGVIDRSSNIS